MPSRRIMVPTNDPKLSCGHVATSNHKWKHFTDRTRNNEQVKKERCEMAVGNKTMYQCKSVMTKIVLSKEWWRKLERHHGKDTDRARRGKGRQLVTSKRCELTFFPFFIHVIRGLGSPAAWHTKDATPPEIPVWSSGDLIKFGKPREVRWKGEGRQKRENGGERTVINFWMWSHTTVSKELSMDIRMLEQS